MGTDTGSNLLDPGDDPASNVRFMFFCSAVIAAVNKHQGLLRASVANIGQDHRLGANEAPPAIISIFLGTDLEKVFEAIERSEEHTSELQSRQYLVCRLLLEKKKIHHSNNMTMAET